MKLGSIEEIEDVTSNKKNKKIDTAKLGITNIAKYIDIQCEDISPNHPILKIGSLVSYVEQKAKKSTKSNWTTISSREIPLPSVRLSRNRGTIAVEEREPPSVSNIRSGFIREGEEAHLDIAEIEFEQPQFTVDRTSRSISVAERLRDPSTELTLDFLDNRTIDQLNTRLMILADHEEAIRLAFLSNAERQELLARIIRERNNINFVLMRKRTAESQFIASTGDPIFLNQDPNANMVWGTSGTISDVTLENFSQFKEEKKVLTFIEKKVENFDSFLYNWGGKPAFIKGYIINNEVITNNDDLLEYLKDNKIGSSKVRTIVRYFYLEGDDKETKSKLINLNYGSAISSVKNANYIIPYILKLKIKECPLSNEVFSDSKYRNNYINSLKSEYIDEWSIETSNPKKIGSSTQCIIIVDNDKKIKFLPQDCIFINAELKGYIVPIDKTITSRSIVRINPKHAYKYCVDNCGQEDAKVISIKTNKSSKKISSNCRNHRMDVITIKTINSNKILLVYAQDLKLIKTITKNEQQSDLNKKKESYSEYTSLTSQAVREAMERTIREARNSQEEAFIWHPIR